MLLPSTDDSGLHSRSGHRERRERRKVPSTGRKCVRRIHRAGETCRSYCVSLSLSLSLSLSRSLIKPSSLLQVPDKKIVMKWRYKNWPCGTSLIHKEMLNMNIYCIYYIYIYILGLGNDYIFYSRLIA